MFYVLGDIHGQKAQLDRALALINADGGANSDLFFLGDLVDRGPDSRGVIQTIIDGQADGRPWQCIRGNHDRMFTRFVRNGIVHDAAIKSGKGWLHTALGGPSTLASYMHHLDLDHPDWQGMDGVVRNGLDGADPELVQMLAQSARAAVPEAQLDWVENLPLWIEHQGHIFVHAGIRPGVAITDQAEDDLIWIREGWLEDTRDHGEMIVHGHTALDFPQHHGNRINLDGGAGYGRPLVPAVFDAGAWFTLSEQGRTLLNSQG